MKTKVVLLTALLSLVSAGAVATERPKPKVQPQVQGQVQVQGQGQKQVLNNKVKVGSKAKSESVSRSVSQSYSGGNTQSVSVAPSSQMTKVQSVGEGGSAAADISIDYEGNDYEYPASTAPSVVPAYCTQSIGGQVEAGGFSVASADPICQHFEAAERMLRAYNMQVDWCRETCDYQECLIKGESCKKELVCKVSKACNPVLQERFLERYNEHLDLAHARTKQTSYTGLVATWFGQITWPAAVIAALVLLI